MVSLGIISILAGVALLLAATFKRAKLRGNSKSAKLPELIIAAYLMTGGVILAFFYAAGQSIPNFQALPIILLLLPAAAAVSESDKKRAFFSATLWLAAGITLAACFLFLKMSWYMAPAYSESVAIIAILFLGAAMFFFKGLPRFILGYSVLLWTINIIGLPETASLAAAVVLGVFIVLSTIFNLPLNAKNPFVFEINDFFAAIANPFIILDPSGKIVYSNNAFFKLSGYERDFILQTEAVELFDIPSNWRFKSAAADNLRQIRCHLISNGGERKPVSIWLTEICNSKNTICNLLCIVHEESDRELLENGIKNKSARFTALYETSLALSSSLEIKDVLKSIGSAAESLTRADSCTILSLDHSRQILKPIYSSDEIFNAEVMNFEIPVGQGLTGMVVREGKPRIQNYDEENKVSVLVPGTKDEEEESLLSVPLMAKDLVIGALTLYKVGKRRFEDDDIKILTVFASQASAIMENSRLYMKLKASEKLYKFSVDLAGDAIFFVDPETGKISDSNEIAQRLFKYSKSDLTAMHIWELQPEPLMPVARRLWQEAKKIGWGKLGEIDYQGHDGSRIPASVIVSIIFTGETSSIQWIVRDISEQKRALERAGFLQQIFERLGEPIFIIDIKGRSLYANEAFCETFNITKDQITKGNMASLSLENNRLEALMECWERFKGKDCLVDQICIGSENNEEIIKTITILPYCPDQGAVKYHVWLFGPALAKSPIAEISTLGRSL